MTGEQVIDPVKPEFECDDCKIKEGGKRAMEYWRDVKPRLIAHIDGQPAEREKGHAHDAAILEPLQHNIQQDPLPENVRIGPVPLPQAQNDPHGRRPIDFIAREHARQQEVAIDRQSAQASQDSKTQTDSLSSSSIARRPTSDRPIDDYPAIPRTTDAPLPIGRVKRMRTDSNLSSASGSTQNSFGSKNDLACFDAVSSAKSRSSSSREKKSVAPPAKKSKKPKSESDRLE